MSVGGVALRAPLLAALAVTFLVGPTVVSADELRILFVSSRDAGHVDAQVRKLERVIRERRGPLAVADSLREAHVVLLFTEHRRSVGEKGERVSHWVGEARLLEQPEEMTVSGTPLPERFELLVIGEDVREEEFALESLELMLSKTLRPLRRLPAREAI